MCNIIFMYIKYQQNLTLSNKSLYLSRNVNNVDSNCSNLYPCNNINCANCNSNKHDLFVRPGHGFSNNNNDILLNPYSALLRDDRIFNNNNYNGPKCQ